MGNVLSHMGRHGDALEKYEEALAMQQACLPPTHPDIAGSLNNIGSVLSRMGRRVDAREQCERTGVTIHEVPIDPVHRAGESALAGVLGDAPPGVAGENIQARLRGLIVMAYSNAHGAIALATGNKSELAVGYCTLYGDMCGGLAPIADRLNYLGKSGRLSVASNCNDRHEQDQQQSKTTPHHAETTVNTLLEHVSNTRFKHA